MARGSVPLSEGFALFISTPIVSAHCGLRAPICPPLLLTLRLPPSTTPPLTLPFLSLRVYIRLLSALPHYLYAVRSLTACGRRVTGGSWCVMRVWRLVALGSSSRGWLWLLFKGPCHLHTLCFRRFSSSSPSSGSGPLQQPVLFLVLLYPPACYPRFSLYALSTPLGWLWGRPPASPHGALAGTRRLTLILVRDSSSSSLPYYLLLFLLPLLLLV